MIRQPVSHSRRRASRVETPEGVWVYWGCDGREETSRVWNLGLGGLFIETREPGGVGAKVKLDFLVQEGEIRAEAVVRHVHSGRGVGLKFTAVRNGDHLNLASLFNRLRRSS
jgi:hypothetical protein